MPLSGKSDYTYDRFLPRSYIWSDNMSEKKKKMGRPTTDPKSHVARLRLSDTEKAKLDECCTLSGLSITEVLKLGIELVHQQYKQ